MMSIFPLSTKSNITDFILLPLIVRGEFPFPEFDLVI